MTNESWNLADKTQVETPHTHTCTLKTSNQAKNQSSKRLKRRRNTSYLSAKETATTLSTKIVLCGVTMKHLLLGKRQRMGGSEVKQKLYKLKKAIYQWPKHRNLWGGGHDLLGTPGYAYGSMHQPVWNRAEKTWYNHNGAFARRVFVATKEKRIFLVSWHLESADFEWHCPICPVQQTKRSKHLLWHNNYGTAVVWNKCQYSVYGKINWNA